MFIYYMILSSPSCLYKQFYCCQSFTNIPETFGNGLYRIALPSYANGATVVRLE